MSDDRMIPVPASEMKRLLDVILTGLHALPIDVQQAIRATAARLDSPWEPSDEMIELLEDEVSPTEAARVLRILHDAGLLADDVGAGGV